jgi:8-oxo-dGTP pyrophosphatase MutT (NUDIX family)
VVHSVPMNASVRNSQDSRLTVVRSYSRTEQPPAEFVRLAHLRKLCECEQVAAVCYRGGSHGIEFLLVRTRGSRRWTFPKGSAEPGLTHAQAAALEAFEEAGVHGRMEEASFTRYVRRKGGDAENHASRSDEKRIAVNAHLCEVLRLSPPKESRRDRTWFSVDDAKRRLREGRKNNEGAEFSRVVDRAVARIQQSLCGRVVDDQVQPGRLRRDAPQWDAPEKDGLQKVQFDFTEACGRAEGASITPYIRRQLAEARREVLPCEVLQLVPSRELNPGPRWLSAAKKTKVLGTGTKHG